MKLVFDAKYGELLGAHLIGANVTEMIAELVMARKLETTGEEIIKAVHPHPTMSEAVMEAAAAAYGEVIHIIARCARWQIIRSLCSWCLRNIGCSHLTDVKIVCSFVVSQPYPFQDPM